MSCPKIGYVSIMEMYACIMYGGRRASPIARCKIRLKMTKGLKMMSLIHKINVKYAVVIHLFGYSDTLVVMDIS